MDRPTTRRRTTSTSTSTTASHDQQQEVLLAEVRQTATPSRTRRTGNNKNTAAALICISLIFLLLTTSAFLVGISYSSTTTTKAAASPTTTTITVLGKANKDETYKLTKEWQWTCSDKCSCLPPTSTTTIDTTIIMHQSYKTSNPQTWHPGWEYHRRTWMDLHPHWFYIFWSDIHNELLAKCIGYQDIMRGRSGIQKADLSRLMYLHKYGGFYSDMDYIALLDHEQLFDFEDNDINSNHDIDNDNNHGHDLKHQMVLLQGRQEQVVGLEWGFARQPEHPIWKFCLDIANRQKDAVRTQCPIFYTGPKFLARCLKKYYNLKSQGKELEHMVSYGNEVMILEPNLIAPIGANDFDSECGKWRSVGVGVGVGIGVGVVGVDEEDSQEQVWMGKWPTSACRQNLIKNGTYAVTIYTHSWGEGLKC